MVQTPAIAAAAARLGVNIPKLEAGLQSGAVRRGAGLFAGGFGIRGGLSGERIWAPQQDE
jgi:hypothetical protein